MLAIMYYNYIAGSHSGLHITLGIFQKATFFLSECCHEVDLRLAHLQTGSLNSEPEFDMYLKTIKEVEKTRKELEYAEEERIHCSQYVTPTHQSGAM